MPTLYDEDQQARPDYVPDDDSLRAITGIDKDEEANMEKSAQEGTAADQAERKSLGLPGASSSDKGEKTGAAGAAAAAAGSMATSAATSAATGGASGAVTTAAKAAQFFWGSKRRKRATIGGGVGLGGVTATIIAIMTLMMPLKVVSMMQNLQDHFSAAGEQATEDMTENLMQHYLVKKVMPGMVDKKCNSTRVSRSCAKVSDSSSVVGQLFEAWRDSNLEGKMASDYGIEIRRDGSNKFYLKTPDLDNQIRLGTFNGATKEMDGDVYAVLNRTQFRNEFKDAIKNATSWNQMYHRYGMVSLAEKKYGGRFCLVRCSETADKVADSWETKKNAFRAYLTQRVIGPRDEMYSLALQCALASFDCGGGDEINDRGEHTSQLDRDLQERLASIRDERFGKEKLEDIVKQADEIKKVGISQHMIGKIIGEVPARVGAKAIPVIDVIDIVASIISAERHIGPALTKLNYAMYSATAVQTYITYRTSADEIKAGKSDLAIAGSVANSLNTSTDTDQGGKSAEQTPLYQNLYGNGPSGVSKETSDECEDGDSIKQGELVCSDMKVGPGSVIKGAQIMSLVITKNPLMIVPGVAADLWVKVVGIIGDTIGKAAIFLIKHSPFGWAYDWLEKHIVELTAEVAKWLVNIIVPNQLGDNPSGGRLWELSGAGADFLANDYAHTGIGGQRLDTQQAAAVQDRLLADKQEDFQSKSLYAKMFDSSDTASLISRAAVAMPTNISAGMSSAVGSLLNNPLGILAHGFGTLFTGHSSAADTGKDPYGITQYGIPSSAIEAIGDPEVFWEKNCQNMEAYNKAWGEKAEYNDDTGQYENTTPNLCMLLQSTAMASGGKFDTGLIPDYQPETSSSETGSAAGGTFTIGTYNILHAENHKPTSMAVGGCGQNPVPGDPLCAKTRSARQVEIVTGQGADVNNPAFDVFGTQETSPTQYNILKQSLTNYDAFPQNAEHMDNRDQGAVAIWWDKTKFKLADSGTAPGISNTAHEINYPWVKLETLGDTTHAGGQQFYFMSIHYSQHDCSDQNCLNGTSQETDNANMRRSAELTREWVQSKVTDDTPVFVVGDTNDNLTQDLSYCILTRGALMQNTWDMAHNVAANPDKPCPTNQNNGIDQIYATPNKVSASNWTHIKNEGIYARASDHTPVYTTVTIESDTSGWVWPAQKIYPGPCWNSHSTGEYHAGMDMNVRQLGVKANAAHSGTVYRVGYDSDAGNYMTVKVNNHLYYSYEHLQSVSVKERDEVLAGQELGIIGKTGNVQLSSSVGHLHMVVSVDGELGGYSSSPQTGSNTRNPLNYLPKSAPNNYTCTQ